MRVTKVQCISKLAAGTLIVAWGRHQGVVPAAPLPARSIMFHNDGRERVQVYLIGEEDNWLLGRLEPSETARLRLPESFVATGAVVVLAVLPGWARSLAPRADHRVALSITEHGGDLPGEERFSVNGRAQGRRQRGSSLVP
jgi:hypothetical protein